MHQRLAPGQNSEVRGSPTVAESPELRELRDRYSSSSRRVVMQISKEQCRLPPELLDEELDRIAGDAPGPFILPLREVFEDTEYIYLVYDPLGPKCINLVDKVSEDMVKDQSDDDDRDQFSETTVRLLARNLLLCLSKSQEAGWVHGCLRMGNVYLNSKDDVGSMRILEFGLIRAFNFAEATPLNSLLHPLNPDEPGIPPSPLPLYEQDLLSLAEMVFLMLSGSPLLSGEVSEAERRRCFRQGRVNFGDKAFAQVSDPAKQLVAEMLLPVHLRPYEMVTNQRCREAGRLLTSHAFFFDDVMSHGQSREGQGRGRYSNIVVQRAYGRWRNQMKWRMDLVRCLADKVSLKTIKELRVSIPLSKQRGGHQLAEDELADWTHLERDIRRFTNLTDEQLKRFARATPGQMREEAVKVHVDDTFAMTEAWRRERTRDVLWQVFVKCFQQLRMRPDGFVRVPRRELEAALSSRVEPVWVGPSSNLDVLFPGEKDAKEGEWDREVSNFFTHASEVSYIDLLPKVGDL